VTAKRTNRGAPRPRRHRTAPPPLRLRSLARRDLAAVRRIDAHHRGTAPKPAYWTRIFRELLGAPPEEGRVGVAAVRGGRLVGYLVGEVRAFEFGSERCGWVLAVAVGPGALRAHVGAALLAEAARRFRAVGVPRVRTMVRRTDVPVLAFFRSSGFAGGPYVQLELDVTRPRGEEEGR
jgi:ribosomal protein S18 acetylase RimI-like enzyme